MNKGVQTLMGMLFAGAATGCSPVGGAINEVGMDGFIDAYKKNPQVKVLDVRTPGEFAQGRVPGAKLLSLQELSSLGSAASEKIPFEKDDEIYVICRSGSRSRSAVQILNSLGYTNAINVGGGTMTWSHYGNPLER